MNICVMEYPEDGDQAQVSFVDYVALQADPDPDCKAYAAAIASALKRGAKGMASMPYEIAICGGSSVSAHEVKLPCVISKSITLYLT